LVLFFFFFSFDFQLSIQQSYLTSKSPLLSRFASREFVGIIHNQLRVTNLLSSVVPVEINKQPWPVV
jgi:hypothetical protein